MNTKAVSPLIAIILIVALSIVIGTMVMNWSTIFTKEQSEQAGQRIETATTCGIDAYISIWRNPDGTEELCYDNATDSLKFTVTNGPTVKLYGLVVTIKDENDNYAVKMLNETNANFPLDKAYTSNYNITTGIGAQPYEVRIMPTVMIGSELVTCGEQKIVRNIIVPC